MDAISVLSHDRAVAPTSAAAPVKLDSDSGVCTFYFPCLFLPTCIVQRIRHCTMTLRSKDLSPHARFHKHCHTYKAAPAAAAAGPGSIRRFRNSKLFSNSPRGPGSLSSSEFTPSGNPITPRGANALFCFLSHADRQAQVWFAGLMQVP
jgi:hypothetical protein